MLLTLLYTCVAFFGLGEFGLTLLCTADAPFLKHLSNNCQGLRHTFSYISTNLAHTRCEIHCEIFINTRFQIKGHKKSARPPSLREILYTDTQALLQLLYKYQHQPQKLWIPLLRLLWETANCSLFSFLFQVSFRLVTLLKLLLYIIPLVVLFLLCVPS
jgi:hypothetical protein